MTRLFQINALYCNSNLNLLLRKIVECTEKPAFNYYIYALIAELYN